MIELKNGFPDTCEKKGGKQQSSDLKFLMKLRNWLTRVLADILLDFYQKPDTYPASGEGVKKLLLEGNQAIYEWGFMPGTDRSQGGCAGTVVWLFEDSLRVFHAGDTAAILIRDGRTTQLTQEHQLENGAIFRYFGLGPHLELQAEKYYLEDSDRILLLSDGITKVIHPKEAGYLVEQFGDSRQAVDDLARRALSLGSTDDITALLVEVEEIWVQ